MPFALACVRLLHDFSANFFWLVRLHPSERIVISFCQNDANHDMMQLGVVTAQNRASLRYSRPELIWSVLGAILLHALLLVAWSGQKGAGTDRRSKPGSTMLTMALRQSQVASNDAIPLLESSVQNFESPPIQTPRDLALSERREKYLRQERQLERTRSKTKDDGEVVRLEPPVGPESLLPKLEEIAGQDGKLYHCLNEKGEPYTVLVPPSTDMGGQMGQGQVLDRFDPCVQG